MKKVIFLFIISLFVVSCSSNDPVSLPETLDFKQFIELLNCSEVTVKAALTGELKSEINTLGIIELKYSYPTNECNYYINFKFTNNDRLSSITIIDVSAKTKTYTDGINFNKILSDRIQAYNKWVYYYGYYVNSTNGDARFTNRDDYWDYVANKKVSESSYETWMIKNGITENTKLIYENLVLYFWRSDNTSTIKIERIEF